MSKSLEELALRKEVLQARSALYRLKAQHEFHMVRNNLQWTRLGAKAIISFPVRSALLGLAFKALRRTRVTRLLAFAGRITGFAKIASILGRWLRNRTHG